MGLCFNLGAVLEGHPDVVLSVNGDVVHHRQPVCFPELRQRLPAPQLFQVGFDLVPSGRALGNQVGDLGVSGLGLIEPGYQTVVAFLVFGLVEGNVSVFLDALLNHIGDHLRLLLEFFLLPLQIVGVKEQGHHLPAIRDDRILGGQQLICR